MKYYVSHDLDGNEILRNEAEIIYNSVFLGFNQLRYYKPSVVRQVKKVMDYLVRIDLANYGQVWRGQYDSEHRIDELAEVAVAAWEKGIIKVNFEKLSANAEIRHID
jgi:hypothetical protein